MMASTEPTSSGRAGGVSWAAAGTATADASSSAGTIRTNERMVLLGVFRGWRAILGVRVRFAQARGTSRADAVAERGPAGVGEIPTQAGRVPTDGGGRRALICRSGEPHGTVSAVRLLYSGWWWSRIGNERKRERGGVVAAGDGERRRHAVAAAVSAVIQDPDRERGDRRARDRREPGDRAERRERRRRLRRAARRGSRAEWAQQCSDPAARSDAVATTRA